MKNKNQAAVELGRKGGKARMSWTPERRIAAAKKAAEARWSARKVGA